jgi:undecaprenyl-phosphate 4-deoxy-4-formamido-L-arabinose transferase
MAAFCGMTTGVYYLYLHFTGSITTPGYASIIVSVLTLGGLQLLGLGVMGEYLGRLHLNVNGKPQYHERNVLDELAGDRSNQMRPSAIERSVESQAS